MRKIRCILGLHKYDKSREKKSLIYEKKGEYFYRYDNECISCGQAPDDTLKSVAEWILAMLKVATFNREGE